MANPLRRSPRIQLTLDPETMGVLEELSELTGQGKATMVAELMREALPALMATREAIRKVKDAPREAQAIMARYANQASIALAQQQLEFDDLLASKPAPKHQKRKRGSDGPT